MSSLAGVEARRDSLRPIAQAVLRIRASRANPSLLSGCSILAFMLAVGVLGLVALPDPDAQDLGAAFAPPGAAGHPLGTDALGRDVLAWISAGVWVSAWISTSVVLISGVVGVALGLCAGYFGGWIDTAVMRIVDVELSIPPLLLFIAAAAALQPGPWMLIVLLSAVSWLPYARLTRNAALVERERGYIHAARLAGATRRRILGVHLLRSVSTTALVLCSLQAGYVLLWESGLSFLGLGIQPPLNSLGFLISAGRSTLDQAWWVVVVPGMAVALLVLAANLIGDGLRDLIHRDVEVLG